MTARRERSAEPTSYGIGMYIKARICQGECKRRRSIFQFDGDSAICKQCQRRMSK